MTPLNGPVVKCTNVICLAFVNVVFAAVSDHN
jgi:hypothetical protein